MDVYIIDISYYWVHRVWYCAIINYQVVRVKALWILQTWRTSSWWFVLPFSSQSNNIFAWVLTDCPNPCTNIGFCICLRKKQKMCFNIKNSTWSFLPFFSASGSDFIISFFSPTKSANCISGTIGIQGNYVFGTPYGRKVLGSGILNLV